MEKKIKVVLTGATGMVGEGVLHECLNNGNVSEILVIGRRGYGKSHPKLRELVIDNLADLSTVEDQINGFDACFFCMGVSSVGMDMEVYKKLTYDLTISFASTLAKHNPGMTFCYVSGAGTDSTESSRLQWARIKGKTENDLTKLPFAHVFNFRPGFMLPTKGLSNALKYYKYISWLYYPAKLIYPNAAIRLKDLGIAMINSVLNGAPQSVLGVKDILKLSDYSI